MMVAFLPGKDEDKDIQFLIAALSKAGENITLETEGMRLYPVQEYAITVIRHRSAST